MHVFLAKNKAVGKGNRLSRRLLHKLYYKCYKNRSYLLNVVHDF